MEEKFVQTVASVNYNRGVFSLHFVGHDHNKLAHGNEKEDVAQLVLKGVVHMPAAGFMYMVAIVKSMLEDPRMEEEIKKMISTGMINATPETGGVPVFADLV
ncbi:hypothetical protein [Chromobacterium amazonense]|uniref:Uncharacterized protein n=1 Tax=Chromobacterium amazonense TaxID=1382803 RepID=A0ABU8V1X4_9NEIS|nr:hypothetical protein [Chromobacterium amazonense]KIA80536.1 hypothetical protein QR66_09815 [Chromobacterium piscinae]MBM2886552.1 hypothetical protein [Chromobacterium amazonense]MDE1712649.1 hypothetical protein [Chromobacterium amazonense]MDQ4540701.1 hypothetical protein [Chromobacterium amazonense]OHX15218.1 hypothetical protein BI343_02355 [Chromobacterium amazonense]